MNHLNFDNINMFGSSSTPAPTPSGPVNINIHYGGSFYRDSTMYLDGKVLPVRGINVSNLDLYSLLLWVQRILPVPVSDLQYLKEGEAKPQWLESEAEWFTLRSSPTGYVNLYATYITPIIVPINIHYGGSFNYGDTEYVGGRVRSFDRVNVGGFDLSRLCEWVRLNIQWEFSDLLYYKQGESKASFLDHDADWITLRASPVVDLYAVYIDWDFPYRLQNDDSGSDNSQDIRPFD